MLLKQSNKYFISIVSVLLAMLATMSPFAIDTYLPAMPQMAEAFGVNPHMVELTVTLYFLGFALGNFLGGPLSDSFGRKTIAVTGIILYGISALLIPQMSDIRFVWILRFTQAFGGGFGTVTVMIFVKDWFHGKQVARMATIISMIMMMAPLIAPVVGTFLIHDFGWKGVFYFLSIIGLVLLLFIGVVLSESRPKELITKQLTGKQLIKKYKPFFKSRKAIFMLFALGFSSAGMFTFITGASFIYLSYYSFDVKYFPILFGSNIILHIILSFLNNILLKHFEPEKLLKAGLILQLSAGITLGVSTTILNHPPVWIVFASIVVFIGALGLIFGNGNAILLNLLPQISGTVSATIGVSRFLISFVTGSLPALFLVSGLAPIGLTMMGSTIIANIFAYLFAKGSK